MSNDRRPERILVLGATGHIGQAVVRHALGEGRSVTAATRQQSPEGLLDLDVSIVQLSPDLCALPEIAAGHDLIVDAAAPYPLDAALPGSEAWRSAVCDAERHVERVIAAARRQRSRLVFVSSFTTLPRPDSAWESMETAWRRSAYPYFEAKLAMERRVLEAAHSGVDAVVVNPAACLGPWEWRADTSSFIGLILAGRLPAVMRQTVNVIDVRDVAIGIDRAIASAWFGCPIPLAGHNVSMEELSARVAALAGISGPGPLAIDSRLAAFSAFWTGATLNAFGQTVPDPVRATPLMADAFPMAPSPAQLAIGLNVRPLDDTLADAIAFLRMRRGRS